MSSFENRIELIFWHVLCSSEGGQELCSLFCRIWSGYDEHIARKALMYFCTDKLSIEGLHVREDLIDAFMDCDAYGSAIKAWFQGITCDGERSVRTIYIMLSTFNHFCADPHYYGIPI